MQSYIFIQNKGLFSLLFDCNKSNTFYSITQFIFANGFAF